MSAMILPRRLGAQAVGAEHVLDGSDHDVLRQRAVSQPAGDRTGQPPERPRLVQVLTVDLEARIQDQRAQPPDPHPLEQVVVLDFASPWPP